MPDATLIEEPTELAETPTNLRAPRRWPSPWSLSRAVARGIASAVGWLFGVASLVLGLSILAALPLAQFLTLGYLLEASGRVARTGRFRDGLIGVASSPGRGWRSGPRGWSGRSPGRPS
jgi:hypothetical protein